MANKTTKIHEFDPLIYPTRIWVGVNVPYKEASEKFYALLSDGSIADFDEAVENQGCTPIATCYPVRDKESGWRGIFCHIKRPKLASVGVTAHEAEHIVCWICEQFGIQSATFDDSEPRAYLMQWVANCIYDVLKGKA